MSQPTSHLGAKPILGLFFGMAAPIALGMMVHGLYNVVDAIFVTRAIGVNAMGGILGGIGSLRWRLKCF